MELLVQVDRLIGGSDAVLVIDDTTIPKKGTHSVGVAAQHAPALGKTANCQTLVSLTLARGEVPVMLALRLFLPRELDEQAGSVGASFRPNIERHEQNRRWLWRRSIVPSRPVCALAASWRMPVMGRARRSARGSRLAN